MKKILTAFSLIAMLVMLAACQPAGNQTVPDQTQPEENPDPDYSKTLPAGYSFRNFRISNTEGNMTDVPCLLMS